MKIYAIIPAAGSGKRFNNMKIPKQYMNLSGKPLIIYSLEAFDKCREIESIIIAADAIYFDRIHSLISKYKIKKTVDLTAGGKTRFGSVKNAFRSIDGKDEDIIIIHDAARPNINIKMVQTIADACKHEDGVIYGIKAFDTIKYVKNKYVQSTIDRENLWMIQTPQAFRYKVLSSAYKKVRNVKGITDEAMLAEKAGYSVKIIEGKRYNIKITENSDMKIMKYIIEKKL